jgi:hypothetical protein
VYPVSTRFLTAIADPHTPLFTAQVFLATGGVVPLDIIGGSVTVDRGQTVRRTCSVTVADTSLIPRTATDKLATFGAQLRISRGVDYRDGTSELVPLGVFRIDSVDGDIDTGPVTISGKSLECVISDDKFTAPYRASGNAVASITALILRSLPSASVITGATVVDATIGARTWDVQGDPWSAVAEIAAVIGAEAYADADGVFVIAVLPDPLSVPPVWTIGAGEGGAYISATRGMTADGVFNAVLASGENTEANVPPVSALVVDADPTSPTYWSGPFGHRPTFYSSATLTTTLACTSAATLLLRAAVAPNASANISALPNPALEPGDVIRVAYPGGSRELHQVQSFPVPLDYGGDFTIATISGKEDA